jgi:hypothetical protein
MYMHMFMHPQVRPCTAPHSSALLRERGLEGKWPEYRMPAHNGYMYVHLFTGHLLRNTPYNGSKNPIQTF